jgi:hypothetical protein
MANENILQSIDRLYSDRQMVNRACNYLVMSEAVYKVFRMEALKQAGQEVESDRQVMEYKGMIIIRLDRDDYTILIG